MDSETLNECAYATKQNEERFLALIKAMSNIIYSMSPDWKTMTVLCGRGFLVDTRSLFLTGLTDTYIPRIEGLCSV